MGKVFYAVQCLFEARCRKSSAGLKKASIQHKLLEEVCFSPGETHLAFCGPDHVCREHWDQSLLALFWLPWYFLVQMPL